MSATTLLPAAKAPTPTPAAAPVLRRACECGSGSKAACRGCTAEEATVRRSPAAPAPARTAAVAPPAVRDVVRAPGHPLAPDVRAALEPRVGYDLSAVRVHDDGSAAAAAAAVHAQAFTLGRHVAFAAGRYRPGTAAGRRLLLHELHHAGQQRHLADAELASGHVPVGDVDDPAEHEAERAAGEGGTAVLPATHPVVRRQVDRGDPAAVRDGEPQADVRGPGNPPPLRVQRGLYGVGRFTAFLDRRRCILNLQLRPHFRLVDDVPDILRPHYEGPPPQPWPEGTDREGEAARYAERWAASVRRRWRGQYVLVPRERCAAERCTAFGANLTVAAVRADEQPDFVVNVLRSGPDGPGKSSTSLGQSLAFDVDPDVRSDHYVNGRPTGRLQSPAQHEAGHMLGLSHVACSANDRRCYGENEEQRNDLMGLGSELTPRHYAPFVETLRLFNGCSWEARPAGVSALQVLGGIGLALLGGLVGALAGVGIADRVGGDLIAGGVVGGLLGTGAALGIYGGAGGFSGPSDPLERP